MTAIPLEKSVSALTVLDDELYVAQSASHDIDVFDVELFSHQRRMTVASVQRTLLTVLSFSRASGFNIIDMTSCRLHRCLYVANGYAGMVHRLDRGNAKEVTQWSVGSMSLVGLSVIDSTSNVLVCCSDSPTLRMYTPLGCPVCEISVQQPAVVGLLNGLQLNCGSFVVVGLTDTGDRLVCVHRNNSDSTDVIDSSGCVTHVAVVGGSNGGRVWLAERGAAAGVRMVQVHTASQCSGMLPTIEAEEPEKIWWVQNNHRMYIVDRGHVKVFHVKRKYDI